MLNAAITQNNKSLYIVLVSFFVKEKPHFYMTLRLFFNRTTLVAM